jgi:hypothetical protein
LFQPHAITQDDYRCIRIVELEYVPRGRQAGIGHRLARQHSEIEHLLGDLCLPVVEPRQIENRIDQSLETFRLRSDHA